MDPTYPNIDSTQSPVHDWNKFYSDVKKPLLPNAPEVIENVLDLHMFVDSDHAGDQHTQRSHAVFFIFLDITLVSW